MKFKIRKLTDEGRLPSGAAIYPANCWTLWLGERLIGWNWDWQRIVSYRG